METDDRPRGRRCRRGRLILRFRIGGREFLPLCIAILLGGVPVAAQQPDPAPGFAYQVPPEPLASALEVPGAPLILPSPAGDRLAILSRGALPSIAEVAEPELGLAAVTINPRNSGPSRTPAFAGLSFHDLDGSEVRVELPPDSRLIAVSWGPGSRHLAFLLLREEKVELWTAEAATGRAERRASGVNAVLPNAYSWQADGSALIVRLVPEGRGEAPEPPLVPGGPIVRQTGAGEVAAQTIHNLLSSPHDERLFDHHFTSRLARIPLDGSPLVWLGEPGLIVEADPSPDGRYILQKRLKRPYSHSLPASAFPEEVIVTDSEGRPIRTIADRPEPLSSLSETPSGPRAIAWRSDAPATLFWAEALPGDEARDRLFLSEAPFRSPWAFADLDMRFQSLLWGRPDLAIASGISRKAGEALRFVVDPGGRIEPRLIQRRAFRGGGEAGTLLERKPDQLHLTPDGRSAWIGLGRGLGRLDLGSGSVTSTWTPASGERLFRLLDEDADRFLVWRESPDQPANLFERGRGSGAAKPVTRFTDPLPAWAGIQVRTVDYRRSDGWPLRGRLYLPPGYQPERDGRLPLLVWAYPASVTGAPPTLRPAPPSDRFVRPSGFDDLPLLFTGRGFAVFEAAMPIVGDADSPPNDRHVEQLVANAEAAIEAVVELGIASRSRAAIAGHSYGAGMVANLLAHSDLFRTGIALSGAYNRTLTPFGFQASERRSFWEAPQAYLEMSPFIHADRINEPLLLVHGTADLNSGTLPIQSERLYAALAGLGAEARLVLLPGEGHQYRARESLLHLAWEMDRWLALHLEE